MADKEEDSKSKRRIRPAEETIREKTVKSAENATKPTRGGKVWRVTTSPFRWIGRGLAKAFHPLGRFKVFRVIGFILVPPYFRNSWKELRQVTWLSGRESRRLTFAVIVFALIFGLLVALVDYGLDKVFKQVLLK